MAKVTIEFRQDCWADCPARDTVVLEGNAVRVYRNDRQVDIEVTNQSNRTTYMYDSNDIYRIVEEVEIVRNPAYAPFNLTPTPWPSGF